jgi:hypothetical protein
MYYKIAVILFVLFSVSLQAKNCARVKESPMNNQPLVIKAKCRGNEQCLYEGKDIFLDIRIINNEKSEIGFPLEFAKDKGPIIRLIDNRTKADTFLPTHPPDGDLREKFTMIRPGESLTMEWVITGGELEQFGGSVDVSAEITIMAEILMSGKKIEFRGSDTLRIVSKNKQGVS